MKDISDILHSEIVVVYCDEAALYGEGYCATVGDYDLDCALCWAATADDAYWGLLDSLDIPIEMNPGYILRK